MADMDKLTGTVKILLILAIGVFIGIISLLGIFGFDVSVYYDLHWFMFLGGLAFFLFAMVEIVTGETWDAIYNVIALLFGAAGAIVATLAIVHIYYGGPALSEWFLWGLALVSIPWIILTAYRWE